MAEMMEYKCPYCGGGLEFNASLQKLKCPFCDSEFELSEFQASSAQTGTSKPKSEDHMEWDTQAGGVWQTDELNGMHVYKCQSCGGEIVGDETLAASKCPYCDSPMVMTGQFSGDLKPDCIIPFKVDKKAAKEAFASHLLDKKLLPAPFRDRHRIEEIKGVYVPFWLFDTELDAEAVFNCERTIATWREGDDDCTEVHYYEVIRGGSLAFDRIPVDGSSKMPDDLMESLEPFDFSEAVDFNTAYLAGYMADKYDVDVESSIENINRRVRTSAEEALRSTVEGYECVTPMGSAVQLKNNIVRYALYPVWILNVEWNNEKYIFAMNGQTGKFVGNLPLDVQAKKSMFRKRLGIMSVVSFLIALAAMLIL